MKSDPSDDWDESDESAEQPSLAGIESFIRWCRFVSTAFYLSCGVLVYAAIYGGADWPPDLYEAAFIIAWPAYFLCFAVYWIAIVFFWCGVVAFGAGVAFCISVAATMAVLLLGDFVRGRLDSAAERRKALGKSGDTA